MADSLSIVHGVGNPHVGEPRRVSKSPRHMTTQYARLSGRGGFPQSVDARPQAVRIAITHSR